MPEETREEARRIHRERSPEDSVRVSTHPANVPGRGLRWHRWTDRAIFEDGRLVEFQSIGEDFTEQHRMTEALRESDERFRLALEHSLTCLYTMDRELRYTWLFNTNFGLDPDAIAGKTYDDLFSADQAVRLNGITQRVLSTGRGELGEIALSREGYSKQVVYSIFPLRDNDGNIVGIIGASRDVTELKRAEAALREKEEHLSEAQRIAHLGSWTRNTLTGVLHWSDETFRIFGIPPGEVNFENFMRCIHPEDMARLRGEQADALGDGGQMDTEYRIIRPDGTIRHLYERSRGIHDDKGRLLRLEGIVLDITERKQAEAALRRSEERLRLVVENSPDTMFIQDRDLRYAWITRPISTSTAAEVIGKNDDELRNVVNHAERKEVKRRVIETGEPGKLEVLMNDRGDLRWQETTYAPYRDHEGAVIGLFGYSRDITARKRAEEALRLSEGRYRIVSELVSDYAYCYRVRPDGTLAREWVTGAFRRITGFTPEEADKRGGWLGIVHPADVPLARHQMEAELAGKAEMAELRLLHKDGGVRWLRNYVFPVIETGGRVERIYGAVQDITAHKILERNIEDLRREYEAYMRHELKNLFIPLRLHSDILLHDSKDDLTPRQRECLEKILSSAIQGAECVDSLRKLQEIEAGICIQKRVPAPLEPVIRKVVSDLSLRGESRGVEIRFENRAESTDVPMDPYLMPGVFFNLVLNAIEHVENLDDPAQKVVRVDMEERNGILVTHVSNRGTPVSPERLATFFEKFNGSGKGQGRLGLGTAYARLVTRAHRGEIRVSSSAEEGTTVTVALPLG